LNRALPVPLKEEIISKVFAEVFTEEKKIIDDFYLSQEDIQELSKEDFEIGSHGRTHPVFSLLSKVQKQDELGSSKRILESIIGKSIAGISYPYGGKGEFDAETIAIAKDEGFSYGVTAIKKVNYKKPDPFEILRIDANDVLALDKELHM
jgi:peptidoglycan/xylan/chitin deacetylase (PgdA/CDA1 family)